MPDCPNCGSYYGRCPECCKAFDHGTADHCDNPPCVAMNAPIDCVCGLVVAQGAKGVLDFDMNLLPFTP
jgi:hypothetical protein